MFDGEKLRRKVGGSFSSQGGHVTGINVDLKPGKRLVERDWRKYYWEKIRNRVTSKNT